MTKKNKSNINDYCVSCGARSNYSKSEPLDHRYGYVEGVGQFCFRCAYFGGVENKIKKGNGAGYDEN